MLIDAYIFINFLFGLFQTSKKNLERRGEGVQHFNNQDFQHLSHSPGDKNNTDVQVVRDADRLIRGYKEACLIIDESDISQKGTTSVDGARWYCGERGNVDNCQIDVYASVRYQKGEQKITQT